MKTKVLKIKDIEKDYEMIRQAASLIREGELVAFPTETVYGLGANALRGEAVQKIFKAKGRPGDNPLIVHIANMEDLEPLVLGVQPMVWDLIQAFWPGPLTIIFKKSPMVPWETTAGLDTVAVRMPRHPVALALIRESGIPIAAPSANRSGKPSPTTAGHVLDDIGGRFPLILDGGTADVGVESTVLDVTSSVPTILRPGGITLEMLQKVIDGVQIDDAVLKPLEEGDKPKSPGMKYIHYAPQAPVIIFRGDIQDIVNEIKKRTEEEINQGKKVGILATDQTRNHYTKGHIISLGNREHPATLAANLFTSLRKFDKIKVHIILAEWIDAKDEGMAVMNRMIRAAGFNVLEVRG